MKIIACDQRSPAWHAARLGRLTGSRVGEAFATIKKGESAGRRNLRMQLVLERLTGQSQENGFCSEDMRRGIELEDEARRAYEARTGILLEQVGFIAHDTLMAGCSPDGLTDDGIIDLKCPKAATHLDYLRDGLPREYYLQLVHGLWLTGRAWAEFISYHPSFPDPLRLKVTRIAATAVDLKAHEDAVKAFLAEVDTEEAAVRTMTDLKAVLKEAVA